MKGTAVVIFVAIRRKFVQKGPSAGNATRSRGNYPYNIAAGNWALVVRGRMGGPSPEQGNA